MITNHTELLNYLAEKYKLNSYLEIGVRNPANNFDKLKCANKVGVDPEIKAYVSIEKQLHQTISDNFFKNYITQLYRNGFDLIFIDGLHHADQVKRDFENSLKCLNDGGFIVIHDTLPNKEEYTTVPRATKIWYGDVYKFAMQLGNYEGIRFVTFNIDCGCTLVWKDKEAQPIPTIANYYDWQTFEQIGKVLLNVISAEELEANL